ncbi:SRPBCC family protein [Jatrophihabitans sp. YIM 134969]
MPERSRQSISIAADPASIMAVIADFEDYPQWAKQVKNAEITKPGSARDGGRPQRVKMTVDAGVFKDTYELEYTWSGDESVSWTLVQGEMQKSQDGTYTLTPAGDVTEVTYELTVDLSIPMLGMLKRKAEKVIMDTALKELKKRVESTG